MTRSSLSWFHLLSASLLGLVLPLSAEGLPLRAQDPTLSAQDPTLSARDWALTEESFRRLHAELQPSGYELWRKIPWQTSVLDAQRLAASNHKPIFIWAMDGHPLGCT